MSTCQAECDKDSRCKSVDYETADKQCYLNSVDRSSVALSDCPDDFYSERTYI